MDILGTEDTDLLEIAATDMAGRRQLDRGIGELAGWGPGRGAA